MNCIFYDYLAFMLDFKRAKCCAVIYGTLFTGRHLIQPAVTDLLLVHNET